MRGSNQYNNLLHKLITVIHSTESVVLAPYMLEYAADQVVEKGLNSIADTLESYFKNYTEAAPVLAERFLEGTISYRELIDFILVDVNSLEYIINVNLKNNFAGFPVDLSALVPDLQLEACSFDTTAFKETASTIKIDKVKQKVCTKSVEKTIDNLPVAYINKLLENIKAVNVIVDYMFHHPTPFTHKRLTQIIIEVINVQKENLAKELRRQFCHHVYKQLDKIMYH